MPNYIKTDPSKEEDIRSIEHHIAPFSLREVKEEIKTLKSNQAPGFDLNTAEILKQLPKTGLSMITFIFNSVIKLKYVPIAWQIVFEKHLIKRMKVIIEERELIPDYQFGFRPKHSTVDQTHRITDVIEKTFEERKICATTFLDVARAFDKVWHEG